MIPLLSDSALQNQLLEIWKEVLQLDQIALTDDFFDIGGNSLLGVQVNSRIREKLHIDLLLDAILYAPTISELAAYIIKNEEELHVATSPVIKAVPRNFSQPLTKEVSVASAKSSIPERETMNRQEESTNTEFSLFFFSADGSKNSANKYELVIESAKLAERLGFSAIWTPERHFGSFGGLYPNPSVLSAAIAIITNKLQIRAGSVVLPLQHPVRVAEEWAVVDNLSGGRVAIACASGWHTNDFTLAPQAYAHKKEIMFDHLEKIQKLWKGESILLPNGSGELTEVSTYPRPLQAELPIWLACHSEDTFIKAGEIGANVVTNLFGEKIANITKKISAYRQSLADNGYDPKQKKVALMVHTYIGENLEEVQATFTKAYRNYLEVNLKLQKKQVKGKGQKLDLNDKDQETIFKNATERLLNQHGLVGTPESCMKKVDFFKSIGVDEIACLIDFGIEEEKVLKGIQHIQQLRLLCEHQSNQNQAKELSKFALPKIVPKLSERYLPFQLTPIQEAYWIGRNGHFEFGEVSTHLYVELDEVHLDLKRLNDSFRLLIERHDILRTIFLPDGRQQVLEQVPQYQIKHLDLRNQEVKQNEKTLDLLRQQMSHQVLNAEQWPLFDIRYASLKEGKAKLFFSFDSLILDAWSRRILLQEWKQLYTNPDSLAPSLAITFRDYVQTKITFEASSLFQKAQDYWKARISTLPPAPKLPLATNKNFIQKPKFVRRTKYISVKDTLSLKERANHFRLTPSVLLLSAYAHILGYWSKEDSFTVNLTVFNRFFPHPQINQVLGDFTNTLLLEVDGKNAGKESFAEQAMRLQKQLWSDLEHSYVSGVEVIREIMNTKEQTPQVLMPIVFTSLIQSDNTIKEDPYKWFGNITYSVSQTPQVWLDLIVAEEDGKFVIHWNAVEEVFPVGLMEDIFDAYCTLLDLLAKESDSWEAPSSIGIEKLLPDSQLAKIKKFNKTKAVQSPALLHTLFAKQAKETPDKVAIISPMQTLSYADLQKRSNQLGSALQQIGARPNKLVAVVMEKGWEQVVAVLGILNSGAAYLPIDAAIPQKRLAHLTSHGEVEIVVTQSWLEKKIEWPKNVELLVIDSPSLLSIEVKSLEPIQQPEDLAYVIYTSGSTGQPKGVMIDHRGAVNTILDVNERFEVGTEDRVLALSSLSFDLSVYDIFGTLAAGATIVMPAATAIRDPSQWADLLYTHKVSIWNSVPALMSLLVEYLEGQTQLIPASLRLVLLSGDWIPVNLPDQVRTLGTDIKVISMGGATEASIWSIIYPIEKVPADWQSIPYGKPMLNQTFHVFNQHLELCPIGVSGELFIGGIGLAKGYWQAEEKSNKRFFPHPLTGDRLYRTGDLGRYITDGVGGLVIEFLGREDFQVKIQGFRVELGEIEAVLSQHPSIAACVVVVQGAKERDKRLIAYVVYKNQHHAAVEELRTYLAEKLPKYMIPSNIIVLEELPLTQNGKVDRKALPIPSIPETKVESLPTVTGTSAQIMELIKATLNREKLSMETNFLSIGATSIDMIRIANSFEKALNYRPLIDEIYAKPSIAGLSELYALHLLKQGQEPNGTTSLNNSSPILNNLLRTPILGVAEQEQFKKQKLGLRADLNEDSAIVLPPIDVDESQYRNRRSHRQFSLKPVSQVQVSELLSCLRGLQLEDTTKYQYGSGGGLYTVQTYLYLQPGRISELAGGIYYYHPTKHLLQPLTVDIALDPTIYSRLVNRPIFQEAAFSIFLVGQLAAITPIYRESSLHYATIEAGFMTQLLETAASKIGLGLCQIGNLNFSMVRSLFKLDESHVLLHSLLGGLIEQQATNMDITLFEKGKEKLDEEAMRLLQRVEQLSDEEVAKLLKELK